MRVLEQAERITQREDKNAKIAFFVVIVVLLLLMLAKISKFSFNLLR